MGKSRFSAVNTKIRGMKSKLLDDEQYIKLIDAPDLPAAVDLLDQFLTPRESFRDMNSLGEVEFSLEKYKFREMKNLRHYFTGNYREFLDRLLLKYEIFDLKNVLRKLQAGKPIDPEGGRFFVLPDRPRLIPKGNTVAEYVEQLKPGPYYRVLQSYRDEDPDTILFYMEMNLDKLYYQGVMEGAELLDKRDRAIVRDMVGRRIDLLNIIWMYRGKKYYDLSPEEIYNFTIIGSDTLGLDQLRKLTALPSMDEFVEEVKKGPYGFLVESEHDIDIYMDRREHRYMYYQSLREFRKGGFDIGPLLAFRYLLNYEIKDIVTILESKSFDLPPNKTADFLVRHLEGSDW